MELGAIVKIVARMAFTLSAAFFFMAVMVLAFFNVGPGERVILAGTVFMTSLTAVGSAILMRKMYKSDAKLRRERDAEAKSAGDRTFDEWLRK